MNETIDSSLQEIAGKNKRSLLLSALCIITCIACVWYLFIAIYGIITLKSVVSAIHALYATIDETPLLPNYLPDYVSEMLARVDRYFVFSRIHQVVTIVNAVICFIGAVLMWRGKRKGFYLYLVAQISYFVSAVLVYWSGIGIPLVGMFTGFMTLISLMMVLIFTLLYSLRIRNLS